jgi:hypothetical protein
MDLDFKFEQLALNFLGAPTVIFDSHLSDQVNRLLMNARFAALGRRFSFPVTAKEVTLPPQQRFWLYNMQGCVPKICQTS